MIADTTQDTISRWLIRFMMTGWLLFGVLDYVLHNKFLSAALQGTIHIAPLFITFLFHLGFVWLHKQGSFNTKSITLHKISGWKIALYLHFFFCVLYVSFGTPLRAFEGADSSYLFSFLASLLSQEVILLLLLALVFGLGSICLDRIPLPITGAVKFISSLVAGFLAWSVLLFFLAYFHQLNIFGLLGIVAVVLGFGWRSLISFFKNIFIAAIPASTLSWFTIAVVYVLPVFVSLNLLAFYRPFPVGFDELLLYLNIPHQLQQGGALVAGNSAYYWSLIMSMGFFIEGNITIVSWLSAVPGIISIFIVFLIAKRFLNHDFALVSATLFYILPTVIWHSSCDAKVDLALTMIFLGAVLVLLVFLSNSKNKGTELSSYLLLSKIKSPAILNLAIWLGALCGWCLGIKYTAFIFIPALLAGLAYAASGLWMLSAAIMLLLSAPLLIFHVYSFTGIELGSSRETLVSGSLLAVLGIGLLAGAMVKHLKNTLTAFKFLTVAGLFALLIFSPWLVKNYQETSKATMTDMLNGKSTMEPLIDIIIRNHKASSLHIPLRKGPTHEFFASLSSDQESTAPKKRTPSASFEEKNRYMGYETGLARYISIFRDACTLSNVPVLPNDAGLFIYLFLPIVFFSLFPRSLLLNIIGGGVFIALVLVSLLAVYNGTIPNSTALGTIVHQHNTSASDFGIAIYNILLSPLRLLNGLWASLYSLTTRGSFMICISFCLAFSAVLIFIQKQTFSKATADMKALLIVIGVSLFGWWLWGSGIVWYGLPVLALLPILIFYSITSSTKAMPKDPYLTKLVWAGTGIVVVLMLVLRMSSYLPSYSADASINRSFIRYACGTIDETAALNDVNPVMNKVIRELNAHPDKKVLRVGTFMNYFIDRNDVRVYADNQLDLFNGIFEATYDVDAINVALKSAGVDYILFDLNTGSIDETPDKSLQKKVERFYLYLNNNKGIEFTTTDRLVEYPGSADVRIINGQRVPVKYSMAGTRLLEGGTLVLIHIL